MSWELFKVGAQEHCDIDSVYDEYDILLNDVECCVIRVRYCEWQRVVFPRVTRRAEPNVLSIPVRQQQQLWPTDQPCIFSQP